MVGQVKVWDGQCVARGCPLLVEGSTNDTKRPFRQSSYARATRGIQVFPKVFRAGCGDVAFESFTFIGAWMYDGNPARLHMGLQLQPV